jgi:FKBP-type peptidyl-prolyl cis-trans isomerase
MAPYAYSLLFLFSLFTVSHARSNDERMNLEFAQSKSTEEGMIKTKTGLMYKVLQQGTGKRTPKSNTPCLIHYEASYIEKGETGTNRLVEYDSSIERGFPLTVQPNQVMRGWGEALQLMKEGTSFTFTPKNVPRNKQL